MYAQIILLALAATAFARPPEADRILAVGVVRTTTDVNEGNLAVETIPYDRCPSDQRHFLLPHEYDCTKFYYCEYGERWLTPTDCAPGTHFSFEIQVCVHPAQAGCTLTGVPPTTPEEEDSPETEEPEPEAPETESPVTVAPETEAPEVTTAAPPSSIEAGIVTTSTASPSTTEAAIVTTTSAPPSSIEAGIVTTTTTAPPSSIEAGIVTTTTTAPPSSIEAGIVTTTTTAPPSSIEAGIVTTSTAAPGSTEASIISTTTTAAPETEVNPESSEWLDNGCPSDWHVHWLLPHEEECNKFYYCNFGEKVERTCPPNTYFNVELQVCDHGWNVDCAGNNGNGENNSNESGNNNNTEESGENNNSQESGENNNSQETGENETIGGSNEVELDNGCPTDWNVHWLLPHESDCSKFYYCVHGEKVERECSPPLHFNPTLQVCDWAENAGCSSGDNNGGNSGEDNNSGNSGEDNNGNSGEGSHGNSEEDNNTGENGSLDNGCPSDWNVHLLLPHESDCGKFYYCVRGEKVERECSSPLHFNPTLQVCDWPENAGCSNGGNGNNSEEDNNNSVGNSGEDNNASGNSEEDNNNSVGNSGEDNNASGNSEEDNNNSVGNSGENNSSGEGDNNESNESEFLENGCPADFNVHWLVPHESDCGKFYYCVNGQKVERECSPPLHFNPNIQVCDWPENAGCSNGENNNTSEEDNNSGVGNSGEDNNESGEDNNVGSGEGNNSNESNEWLENGCPADFNVHWLVPHESDCGKFYYCVNGQKVERECSPPLHFNPANQVCDWPQNAGCSNGEDNNTSEEDNNSGIGNSGEDNNSSVGSSGENNNSGESNESEWLENGCPADFNVHWLVPHESDCGKFYYCVNGEKVERKCSPPLHFNPEIQVCDWPQNVNCGNNGGDNNSGEDNNSSVGNSGEDNNTGENSGEGDNNSAGNSGEDNNSSVGGSGENESNPGHSEEDNNNSGDGSAGHSGEDNNTAESSEEDDNSNVGNSGENNNSGESNESEWLENGCPADFNVHWLVPHESDCSKFYYCVNGQKVERECSPPLHFNPAIQVCDWPQNAGCSNGEDNNTSEEDNNSSVGNSSEDNNNSNESNESEWLENGCPADFNVHWLVPHESDCGKFYYCVNGQKVERECSPPLHFNPAIQVCDWPQNAGCSNGEDNNTSEEDNNSGVGNSGEDNNSSVGSSGENNNSGESNESEWLENGCPADFNVHWLVPHESDCGKFYYCVNGEKVERDCSPPLHFNPEIQVCDWPANVNCGNNGGDNNSGEDNNSSVGNSGEDNNTGENSGEDNNSSVGGSGENESNPGHSEEDNNNSEDGSAGHSGENNNTAESSEEGDNSNVGNSGENNNSGESSESEWLENGCPADFNVHWLVPHESDCSKFYYCVNGQKVERECSPPLHFNPAIQVCDWPQNAGCSNGEDNNTSEEDNNSSVGNSGEDNNGSGEGNNSNESNESEWLENGCPADFNVHWLVPHESDCGKFYYCVNGQKVERECSPPLHFNPTIQVCDWPENAGCSNGGNSNEDNNSSVGSGEDNNTGSGEGSNSGSGEDNNSNESNESEWLENGCPADFNVHWLVPHESDCGKFYYCVNGQKVERECSPPLHFNPAIQVCDWPENVNCGNGDENNSVGNSGEDNNNTEENGSGDNNTEEHSGEDNNNSGVGSGENSGENNNTEEHSEEGSGENNTEENSGEDNNNSGVGSVENNTSEEGDNSEENVIVPEEEPDHSRCEENCNTTPWAHESACDKYWRCEGNHAVLVVCSEGLHFNAKSGTCDFICNANCLRDNVQTTADNQGLKIFVPWDKVGKDMKLF